MMMDHVKDNVQEEDEGSQLFCLFKTRKAVNFFLLDLKDSSMNDTVSQRVL